jgi:NDP-sugar pyrophosphorylase family protein
LRLRAVVLAAGLGTRLRPLTGTEPKPALPVAGVPVAGRTLALLARAGCERAAVNLHHLGDRLRAALGDRVAGMPLVYSEESEVQGTLGALWPLRDFCAAADVLLVINGDSLCRWPLARLLRAHRRARRAADVAATLLLSRRADPAEFGGGVGVGDGRIVTFDAAPHPAAAHRRVFAGAHVIEPGRLEALERGPAGFVDGLYRPLLERGEHVAGVETGRPWHDLGTPERYRRAVLEFLFRHRPWLRRWTGRGARVAPSARLRRSAVEARGVVEPGARLSRTVVLPGARVGREARLEDCLVGFDARVPAGAEIAGQLITPAIAADPAGGSRVGNLVFTPLSG